MNGYEAQGQAIVDEAWRSERHFPLGLGAVLLGLGGLGSTIVLAAAEGSERIVLALIFFVVAILPGALLVRSARKPNPLASLFAAGGPTVTGTGVSYESGLTGYRARVSLALSDGTTHTIETSEPKAKQLLELLERQSQRVDSM